MLTKTDKGGRGGGVCQMLTIADRGGSTGTPDFGWRNMWIAPKAPAFFHEGFLSDICDMVTQQGRSKRPARKSWGSCSNIRSFSCSNSSLPTWQAWSQTVMTYWLCWIKILPDQTKPTSTYMTYLPTWPTQWVVPTCWSTHLIYLLDYADDRDSLQLG